MLIHYPKNYRHKRSRNGSAGLILLATLFAVLAVPWEDDRALSSAKNKWKLHDQYLDGLAETLTAYKRTHGDYPDNNKGLDALDTFDSRFNILIFVSFDRDSPKDFNPTQAFESCFGDMYSWRRTSEALHAFRSKSGRAPQNANELQSINFRSRIITGPDEYINKWVAEDRDSFRRVEVAISRNDSLYLLGSGCVYDPAITPYVYENRNGLDKELFSDSIATRDVLRRFSRKVAPGVFYIYSYNARVYYRTYRAEFWKWWGKICGFGLLSLWLCVIALRRGAKFRLMFPVLGVLVSFFSAATTRATCYRPRFMFRTRPRDLKAQKQLLEKFHDSGVIDSATYAKALNGFKEGGVFQPVKEAETETKRQ